MNAVTGDHQTNSDNLYCKYKQQPQQQRRQQQQQPRQQPQQQQQPRQQQHIQTIPAST